MEELLEAINNHNKRYKGEEQVEGKEVIERYEEAVEDIMENLFDADRIHAKIDRWFDGGDMYNYDTGGLNAREWGYAVIKEAKNRVNKKIYG